MSHAPLTGRPLRASYLPSKRNVALSSAALALIAAICGQSASAQMMERMNAQANAAANPQAAAAAAAAPNPNCTLIVPNNLLTAQGLATPYQLFAPDAKANGPCHEFTTTQSAFVQAAIIDPATGAVSVYNPLVIDKGTKPAVAPTVPTLPANAIVAVWFGFNGTNLTLQNPQNANALGNAKCVNGSGGTVFGQFAYCNAPAFFKAANAAIANGQLVIPALANGKDGKPCPTVRDYFMVDQDQSDNLPVSYLVTAKGQLAQNTVANVAALPGATQVSNPSDNGLTDKFLDGALGCTPVTGANLTDPAGQPAPALALNELQARVDQATPVATVPAGDPMVLVNNNESLNKTNKYRLGVDQPTADAFNDADTARYCRQMLRIAPARLFNTTTMNLLANFTTPDPAAANNLFNFLTQRFVASWTNLNCQNLIGLADPITVTANGNGVVVKSALNTKMLNQELQRIAGFVNEDNAADSSARSQNAMN